MVVKTDTCFYTENRIYPGHGCRFVHKNGKLLYFLNQKARSLYFQKIKPLRLTWTQAWRRKNKKGRAGNVRKKRRKIATAKFKSIQGLSINDIKKKQSTESKKKFKSSMPKNSKVKQPKNRKNMGG